MLDSSLREAILPREIAPLFDERFVRSNDLIKEYVSRSALGVAAAIGLEAACARPASIDEVCERTGLAPEVGAVPLAWLCETLAERRWLARVHAPDGSLRYRVQAPLPTLDPAAILEAQRAHDARALPSFRIVALALEAYPAVLRGEMSGEEALFSRRTINAWYEYFSNDNPLYAVNNALHALALRRSLEPGGNAVLEIGAGLGSASEAFLESQPPVASEFSRYHVTDISPQFLRRSRDSLSARFASFPLSFGWLDIDQPLAPQGVAPGSFTLIHGVNVLHAARDLASTLAELRTALSLSGTLVITECVRPQPGAAFYVEFVFNLLPSFRSPSTLAAWRPRGGFLTPEQWTAALEANGFGGVEVFPDIARIRDSIPGFVVASVTARRT